MRLLGLKMRWLKVILLLMVLTTANSMTYSQISSTEQDTIKCFSILDAKTLLKYAERGYLCDSLSIKYEEQIETFKDIVSVKDSELLLVERLIQSQAIEIKRKHKEIRWLKIAVIGLSSVAILELLIIITP